MFFSKSSDTDSLHFTCTPRDRVSTATALVSISTAVPAAIAVDAVTGTPQSLRAAVFNRLLTQIEQAAGVPREIEALPIDRGEHPHGRRVAQRFQTGHCGARRREQIRSHCRLRENAAGEQNAEHVRAEPVAAEHLILDGDVQPRQHSFLHKRGEACRVRTATADRPWPRFRTRTW